MKSAASPLPSTIPLPIALFFFIALFHLVSLSRSPAADSPWPELRILGRWDADHSKSIVFPSQAPELEGKTMLGPEKNGRRSSFAPNPSALIAKNQGIYELIHNLTRAACGSPHPSSNRSLTIIGKWNSAHQHIGLLLDQLPLNQPLRMEWLHKLMHSLRSLSPFPSLNDRPEQFRNPRTTTGAADAKVLSYRSLTRWIAGALALAGMGLVFLKIKPDSSSPHPKAWQARWSRTRRAWWAALICATFAGLIGWSLSRPADWSAQWDAESLISEDFSLHRVHLSQGARLEKGFSGLSAVFEGKRSAAILDGWAPTLTWTLEAWVRSDQPDAGFQLIAGGPTSSANYGLAIVDGHWAAIHSGPNKSRAFLTSSNSPPTPRKWNHLAALYNGLEVALYLNGKEIARSASQTNQPPADISEMHIGCGRRWIKPERKEAEGSFHGAVDLVRLYHRALDPPQVAQLYRSSLWPNLPREFLADLFISAAIACFILGLFLIIPHLLDSPGTLNHRPIPTEPTAVSKFLPFRAIAGVLIVGLTASITFFRNQQRQILEHDRDRFRATVESFLEQFDTRTEHYVQQVIAARNAINAYEDLTPELWDSLMTSLQIKRDYPGLFSLSYAPWIPRESIEGFQAWAQLNVHPAYAIQPQLADEQRFPISTRYFGSARPRLPLLYEYFNEAPEQENLKRTSPWGLDWAAIPPHPTSTEMSDLDAIRVACDRDDVHCGGNDSFYPRTRYGPEIKGTSLFLGVVQWQEPQMAQESASYNPEKSLRRPRGVLRARLDWKAFFEGWLGDHPPDFAFDLFSPHHGLLCRYPKSIESSRDDNSTLNLNYQSRFYSRRLHFQFQALPAFFLQSHKQWPWLILILGVVLTLSSACLLWIQVRARLHQQSIAAQLQVANDQLQSLINYIERITRDLHDGTIQNIYAIGLGLKRCQALVDQNPGQAKARLAETVSHLSATIAELRQFILSLEPDLRSSENLKSALQSLVDRFQRTTSTVIELSVDAEAADGISSTHSVHLLNIVREALSNSLRHSSATQISIELKRRGPCRILLIRDNGQGFECHARGEPGRGLTNMETRARELHGELNVLSSPSQGTTVSILLPT